MINFDEVIGENTQKCTLRWVHISYHPYRILIVGSSESRKTNALLNLIGHQPDADKIHLYVKDPYELKYQHLTNMRQEIGQNVLRTPRPLSNT